VTEAADPGADHTHSDGGLDPHFWLDPSLVSTHLHTVCDTLCGVAPQHCGEFRGNLIRATAELEAVDRRVAATLAPFAGRALFVFHPAYGYFARRYSLRQLAVEIEGKEPTARQLAGLIDAARAERVRAVFVQPQFSGRSARAVAEAIGVELVELDPLAADPIANLEIMAAAIAAAYGG
jgi:zinc transport system substrate-binding protein